MNSRSKKSWVVRSTAATLLAGVVALGSGCDAMDSVLAIAKTTATGAVTETVSGFVGEAVDGVFGNLTPNLQGG